MVGIQPPSSRIRLGSGAAPGLTAPSPRRSRLATVVGSGRGVAPTVPARPAVPAPTPVRTEVPPPASVPLESVVIRDGNIGDSNGDSNGVKSTNVKVCVRLRPLLASDFKDANGDAGDSGRRGGSGPAAPGGGRRPRADSGGVQSSWTAHPTDPTRISQAAHTAKQTEHRDPGRLADYAFDRVYSPGEATERLYRESVRGVVSSVVDGFHGSVFAYGQTNSGKTHTMAGSPSEPGVVRLAVQDVFHRIRSQAPPSASREYLVRVSYLEIYNEQIYDLLAPPPASPRRGRPPPPAGVRIFESRAEGVVVRGLREEIVTRPEEVHALLDGGDARRRTGSTGMNRTSSRSHSVFRLVLESRASRAGGAPMAPSSGSSVASDADSVATGRSSLGTQSQSLGAACRGPVRISSLSLVDLAGSESVKATGSTGVRQKEGQYINKSLLTLGHVVHKLSDMGARESRDGAKPSKGEHIPYRDSKLTRLLQPSLGGNAQVCVVCNISPALANLEESHNTLKFAQRAKRIRQRARITEVSDEKTLLRSYREEIEELRRQLKEAKGAAKEVRRAAPARAEGGASSDEDDQDDKRVLVSAIANLESLILKGTGASNGASNGVADPSEAPSPAKSAAPSRSSPSTPTARRDEDDNHRLLDELHRIQGMLGTVMKKKRRGGAGGGGGSNTTPERNAEVERLRLQLQEQEVASTMRKADSSFLQSQLNVKEGVLKEVSVLLEALEERQLTLERENKQLREDLAEAANMIEEGDAAKKLLEEGLAERDARLVERECVAFVERSAKTAASPEGPIVPQLPGDSIVAKTTAEMAPLPKRTSSSSSSTRRDPERSASPVESTT